MYGIMFDRHIWEILVCKSTPRFHGYFLCSHTALDKETFFSIQVEEAPATNGTKNGKESSKEPDSNEEVEDVDIDDI